jgi:hypothetical protein
MGAKSAVLGFARLVSPFLTGNPSKGEPQVEHLFKTDGRWWLNLCRKVLVAGYSESLLRANRQALAISKSRSRAPLPITHYPLPITPYPLPLIQQPSLVSAIYRWRSR